MPSTTRPRRPRYARPTTAPAIQITARDIALLEAHARHRFLSSHQAAALFPDASSKKIIERIGLLDANGYLQRPPAQVEYFRAGGGSHPIIHAIANKGARLLAERANIDPGRLTWSRKNDHATRFFIHHTLAVADIAIAVAVACRRHPTVTLQQQPELIASLPPATRDGPAPLKLTAPIIHTGERIYTAVIPDLAFALKFPDTSRRAFLVEVDRGTMPVERHTLRQTSLLKKCLVYDSAYRSRTVEHQIGWKAFRLLIVTTTPERADNIRAAIQRTPSLTASHLFLTAAAPSLSAAPDILTFPWRAADGSTHSLLP